ncbi:hypothetical protein ACIQ9P_39085 [Kitasatospora sp. NPDC094019]|uniref:hypothetical protein n=1 Tax=Kitasatospora sp. NPDC094019 TaxID=3364091 RepID=UPI00380E0871
MRDDLKAALEWLVRREPCVDRGRPGSGERALPGVRDADERAAHPSDEDYLGMRIDW